jgi:hypothetical protein
MKFKTWLLILYTVLMLLIGGIHWVGPPAPAYGGPGANGICSCWCQCVSIPDTDRCEGTGYCCIGEQFRWPRECFCVFCFMWPPPYNPEGQNRRATTASCLPADLVFTDAFVQELFVDARPWGRR